jgi:type IV fimbrial biogenesis protein FimT
MAARTSKTGPGLARTSGFTMIELLMTIAIGSIVMALAIPSFRYVTNSNRVAAEINGLLGDLQFARSEALKDGKNVTVCVSNNGLACTGENTWELGWIVFPDPTDSGIPAGATAILRFQKPFTGGDSFAANNGLTLVSFNREGYAGGILAGTLIKLHDSNNIGALTRCLSLNFVGQITTERANGTTCT